eukprot:14893522-Alexandrium_andersonii.AAC.1
MGPTSRAASSCTSRPSPAAPAVALPPAQGPRGSTTAMQPKDRTAPAPSKLLLYTDGSCLGNRH